MKFEAKNLRIVYDVSHSQNCQVCTVFYLLDDLAPKHICFETDHRHILDPDINSVAQMKLSAALDQMQRVIEDLNE